MKRFFQFTAFLGAALVSLTVSAEPVPESKKVKLGILLPLSGHYAAVGVDNQQGIEIAKLEIPNAERFEFIYADSKADPTQAISEFRKLLDIDRAVGVFVFRGPPGMAVNPISKSSRIPLLGGVGNKDFALSNPYAFQLWVRSDTEGEFLADQMKNRGMERVGIVTVQDDWPVAVSAGFRSRARANGLEVVLDHDTLPSDSDFRSTVTKFRASKLDAIFLNVGLNQIGPFAKQLRELGIQAPIYSNFWAGKTEVIDSLGEAGEGMSYAEMSTEMESLKSELKSRFGSSPSGATLSSYIATILFSQALGDLKDDPVNPESFYASLLNQKQVRTRNGTFEIKDRFVQFPMVMRQIERGVVKGKDS